MCTPHYSVKWTGCLIPLVPGLYKIHLDYADTCLPLMQSCSPLLIDSTTEDYDSAGGHSTSSLVSLCRQHTEREKSTYSCQNGEEHGHHITKRPYSEGFWCPCYMGPLKIRAPLAS